jgi:glycosyltransferase involved in cell wall biosynthesis
MKWTLQLCLIVAAFLLGMNSKKVYTSVKKKWKATQPVKVFAVTEHKPFVVIIPSYNNAEWVEKNLGSVLSQDYDNFRVIYIDDASLDGTWQAVKELASASKTKIDIWHNEANCGAMENIYRAATSCSPEEIVVMVDGDDWLPHEHVLEKLNAVYADPDVWMTCGNYLEYPSYSYTIGKYSGEIPEKVIAQNAQRQFSRKTYLLSHLKTFYAGLFHKIGKEDLQFEGKFFDTAPDQAMMIPMAEMAGYHYRHIKDVLYIYNRSNIINEDKVRGERVRQCAAEIHSRKPYRPLQTPLASPKV